jgi:hypothetical protein
MIQPPGVTDPPDAKLYHKKKMRGNEVGFTPIESDQLTANIRNIF